MKTTKFLLSLVMIGAASLLPVSASVLGDIRVNARFLTDRMAFELDLNQTQYNDLFEINFDFFHGVDPYIDAMARGETYALEAYYRFLDERNDDLRWILSSSVYTRFMGLEYFFRPIYALNNVCYIGIYKIYPNRSFFYFSRPVHYFTYNGLHSRRHCKGISYYRTHYKGRYHHPVYKGHFRSRPDLKRHNTVKHTSSGKPGYHFTPVASRPVVHQGKEPLQHRTTDNPSVVRQKKDKASVRHASPVRSLKGNDKKIREPKKQIGSSQSVRSHSVSKKDVQRSSVRRSSDVRPVRER